MSLLLLFHRRRVSTLPAIAVWAGAPTAHVSPVHLGVGTVLAVHRGVSRVTPTITGSGTAERRE